MPAGIAHDVFPRPVVAIERAFQDLRPGRPRPGTMRVRIPHHDIDAVGDAAELLGQAHVEEGAVGATDHEHAATRPFAKDELGMDHPVIRAGDHQLLDEAEGLRQKADGGLGVGIAQAGDHGG